MWKQQKKRAIKKESHKILGWLKAVISLMIVLGLTWVIGLFVVEIEELTFLAYLYAIATVFQGFFLFLVLVVFTKAVRDEVMRLKRSQNVPVNQISDFYLMGSQYFL